MRNIDDAASVSQSVCLSVTRAGCAKTAERMEVLLGLENPVNPTRGGSDGDEGRGDFVECPTHEQVIRSRDPVWAGDFWERRTHWVTFIFC